MAPASPLASQVQHDVHTQAPLLHSIFGRRFALYRGSAYGLILIMLGVIGFTLADLVRLSGLPLVLILAQPQTIILLLTFLVFGLLAGVFAWQTSLRALERRFTRQLVASLQPDAPAGTARSQVLAANLNLLTQGPQALRFKTSEVRTRPTNVPGKTLLVIPLYRRQGALDHAHQLTMVYVTAAELAQFKSHLARN
ncbi:hypothetical protein [Levilactobacillus zymae]|uniref:hypothetical protein n=1 Tax=Levilactobacillus zymae TaxID=267363 RepID=UPI0028B400D7|nr:hypothetical protein [Levilactobacillus zymae]MDT6979695.1 hypothetical protein [Levilactobacillus zymae]